MFQFAHELLDAACGRPGLDPRGRRTAHTKGLVETEHLPRRHNADRRGPIFLKDREPIAALTQIGVGLVIERSVETFKFRTIGDTQFRMTALQLQKEIKMFAADLELLIPADPMIAEG